MQILFLNHKIKNCGVYQYGLRIHDILKKSNNVKYNYIEIENIREYNDALSQPNIIAIIYNYHGSTMPWLNETSIQRKVKNIGIPHESAEHFFDIICNIDPTAPESLNHYSLSRPIFENIGELLNNYVPSTQTIKEFIEYKEDNIPIFGSFGFGFGNKGFDKIVRMVNEQYDYAIIKFVIPDAFFDPNRENTANWMETLCIQVNSKPNIKLMISHEFFTTEDILKFLQLNTMNIFLYDDMFGRGVSSTIDYALSVKRPLGISNSYMFRNIYSDKICLYKVSIEQCIKTSFEYCSKFLQEYSHENLIKKIDEIVLRML